jgi:hypothetical protein
LKLIADASVSLSEFRAALPGHEVDIVDAVNRQWSLDKVLQEAEKATPPKENHEDDEILEYYEKEANEPTNA